MPTQSIVEEIYTHEYLWRSGTALVGRIEGSADDAPGDASLWPSDHAGVWADLGIANSSSSGRAKARHST
jgi:hypothetical protein